MAKLKRFVKGSLEAKRYMSRLRNMRKGGTTHRRKATYSNGVFTKHHQKRLQNVLRKAGLI